MKILVAEDDRVTRTRILSFLKEWGHEPVAAADGDEAWQLFQRERPEMVVTDWLMPGMDGPELLKKIRASEPDSHGYVYAILLTSRTEKSDVVSGMESGADDFVSKPFDKDELRVRIQAAQRIIELERALAEKNRRLADANEVLMTANHRMKESLLAAARIQKSYLPEIPPRSEFAGFAWVYEPCDELGGDTLNIVPLDAEHVGIYLMDVSGHGVPAALLSVHLSRYLTPPDGPGSPLRRKVGEDGFEPAAPAEVAANLNRHFAFDDESSQYFTAVYGVLDLPRRVFHYTSAGHPGPLVISKGRGTLSKPRPPAIGFIPVARFKDRSVACEPGDRLYFYTDGVFEICNPEGEEFGQDRLRDVLVAAAAESLPGSLHQVIKAARAWSGGEPFDDDVSLIGVEIR